MKYNFCFVIYLFVVLCGATEAQLQVQIKEYHSRTETDNSTIWNLTNFNSHNFTFPSGFSTDWFTTTYANIPPEGITGLLYHAQPSNGCSPLNTSSILCSLENLNLSKIALMNDYHLCLQQKLYSIQDADFDAMITVSPGDRSRGVGTEVFDRSTGEAVDVAESGIPVVVVSEAFASILLSSAITVDCDSTGTVITVVRIDVGPVDVKSVRLGLTFFIVLSATLVLFAPMLVCYAVFTRKKCHRRTGSYDVHHMQELNSLETVSFNRTQGTPYAPEQEMYCHDAESSSSTFQCPICLENFIDGETVSVLHCDGKHRFHSVCIDKWLLSQSTCPVCRSLMIPPIQ